MQIYCRLDVYVPETHLELVKNALLDAGAGRIGSYDRCCWQTRGEGQFRALEGSNPFLGTIRETEHVIEWKLEFLCRKESMASIVAALRRVHPYETPAFQSWDVRIN